MVSIDMYIYKEQREKKFHLGTIICLFIAFLTVSGCSKSGKDDVADISTPELSVINESLRDYMFSKQDFNEPNSVWAFLQELAALHYDSYPLVGSGGTLWSIKRDDISSWLRAKEKSEAVFRKLCSDPQFVFEGNKWMVVFNVFKKDGGVDKWEVVGEHDPDNKYNHVEKVEISVLKPKGTFSWPLMG